jgi:hypothetical protein
MSWEQAAEGPLQPWEHAMTGRSRTEEGMRRKLDADLDRALAQTFPASDPFSVGHFTGTEPPSRPVDTGPAVPTAEKPAPGRRKRRRGS